MANKPDHWSDEETYELIAIWSDDAIQRKLESSYHKWTSYSFIADKLREKGFQDRDANSVLQKLKRLKTMYRKKKHSWANLLSSQLVFGTRKNTIVPRQFCPSHQRERWRVVFAVTYCRTKEQVDSIETWWDPIKLVRLNACTFDGSTSRWDRIAIGMRFPISRLNPPIIKLLIWPQNWKKKKKTPAPFMNPQ